MTTKQSILAAAAVTALALGTAGCGSDGGELDGLSATEVAERTVEAMNEVESLSVDGTFETPDGEMQLQASISRAGQCTGTMTMTEQGETEFRSVDGTMYIKAADEFWDMTGTDGTELNEKIAGRWLAFPDGQGGSPVGSACDMDQMVAELESEDLGEDLERIDGEDVDGTPTVGLQKQEGEEVRTTYIADSGEAYIMKMTVEGTEDEGSVTYSDYNQKVEVDVPDESDTVSLEEVFS
ncbi:hypothetical protein PJ985_04645 [Streptomyces sp. ACA25]|uniref:hypothetical protein n=1 Tax=Streptomyces sp. ACA25 TaxID=3022596 RepID=UPI002306E10A|nr:hypothetical protein [Streptomyces sp. ACA25]MDB1086851.1 hypothetical protein [Streptomyces sp. ACA25]